MGLCHDCLNSGQVECSCQGRCRDCPDCQGTGDVECPHGCAPGPHWYEEAF
jgi:hypothetical protein